jgi:hypothetical protein
MPIFSGQLRANEIFGSIFNMIISQQVFADNIADNDNSALVNKARVDGGLFGDTKLYYSTDVLKSHAWLNDGEATNLLKLARPKDPECQAIVLDTFRQIDLTVDNYLTKRAWSTEGAFTEFNSVMLGWIRETKKIYDFTTYNAFFGTNESTDQTVSEVEVVLDQDGNSAGENIAVAIADLIDDLGVPSRDYNDYGNLRSYSPEAIKIVWNNKYVNAIRKIDLPSIFHNDNLVEKLTDDKLNHIYFGTPNTTSGTTSATNTNVRALVESDYEVSSSLSGLPNVWYDADNNKYYMHLFAGDLLPNSTAYAKDVTYTNDDTIICKVVVKYPPFMSAFETGTSFFNAKSLTENHYLTWGHNTLEHLKNYPFITVRATTTDDGE